MAMVDLDGVAPVTRQPGWDLPVRLFHWSIVVLVAFSWWSAEERLLDWHRRSGYAVLALILFRLAWGVCGSHAARFSSFVRGPGTVARYIRRDLFSRTAPVAVGHNPIGGWSVLAMLAALLVQTLLGLFAVDIDGIESGPLSSWVDFETGRLASQAHGILLNIILALIGLHVLAILFYLLRKRANLVRPMLFASTPVTRVTLARSAGLLLLCSAAVWALVTFGG